MDSILKKNFMPATTSFLMRRAISCCLATVLILATFTTAWAWPTDSQWIPIPKGGTAIQDSHIVQNKNGDTDATGSVNVVPYDGSLPAAYVYNDGSYLHYRLRLDSDPRDGGNGILASFGWGFEIDTDQNADDYEWLIMCDGISQPEVVSLRLNTDKTGVGDPSDKAEYVAAEYPLVGNHRVLDAGSCINDSTNPVNGCGTEPKDDRDYFLDFRIPYAVFLAATGIKEDTLIRYFVGSSNSTNNLTEQGADLLAGSDLYSMASDFITPTGALPSSITFHDGTVKFADDLGGFGDMTMASVDDTLFIRVDDKDLDLATNPSGTVRVELESANTGDIEVLILSATGVQGKFTGSIVTSATDEVGVLAVTPNDTITVTYIDAVDSDYGQLGKTVADYQNQPRTDTLTISAANTDLGITKTVSNSVPSELDNITYTIIITNHGPNNVDNIVITDTLPGLSPDLLFSNPAPSVGTFNLSTGVWDGFDLDADAIATLNVDATVQNGASGSSYTNTASITSSDQDGTTTSNVDAYATNDTASSTVSVGSADLRITKTVNNDQPTEGDKIIYQLRVLNLGPNNATNVSVEDILPTGVTYNSATGDGSFSGSTWTIGTLSNGSGALLDLAVNIDSGTSGDHITNTANILTSDQPDPDSANDSDNVTLQVDYIDLELAKSVNNTTPDASDATAAPPVTNTVTYTITVTNNGPHDASGIQVTDLLPTGVTYQSHTSTPATAAYDPATGLWEIGDIIDQSTAALDIIVVVDDGTTGQSITNSAEITAVDQPDRDSSNDEDAAAINVSGTDIQITKTVSEPNPDENQAIIYYVTVANNGPNPATGLQVTDILPGSNNQQIDGVSYDSSSATQGTYSGNGSDWVWDIGNLAVSSSATLTINATVENNTAGQDVVNTAMITAVDQADPDGTNNAASALIAVDGTDIGITKVVDNAYPDIGDFATYTITVTNNGPSDATNIEVTDLLPPELVYNGAAMSQGTYNDLTGLWVVGDVTVSSTATLELNVEVRNEDKSLSITNTASISDMDQGDPTDTNDSDTADIYIAASNLSLSKTVDNTTPNEGSTISYLVTVKNEGNNPVTEIEIEDILPVGVTYNSHSVSQGIYAAGLWLVADLPVLSDTYNSATLTINATVDSGTEGTTITNTAEITSLAEIDPDNSDDIASVDIVPAAPLALPSFLVSKGVVSYWDPVNGTASPYAIPGGIVQYTLTITNTGLGTPDNSSIVITDPIPENTELVITDPAVTISNVVADTGLTINFISPTDNSDDIYFSTDGSDFTYQPTADANGADLNVSHIRFNPQGIFSASDGTTLPTFSVGFKVRIK